MKNYGGSVLKRSSLMAATFGSFSTSLHGMMESLIQQPTLIASLKSKILLEKIIVTTGMLERRNVSQLYQFKNLTTLCIHRNVLQNIQVLYELLEHLPRLHNVYVYVPGMVVHNDDSIGFDNGRAAAVGVEANKSLYLSCQSDTAYVYPTIQDVILYSYYPQIKNETDILMNAFSNIHRLCLIAVDCTGTGWPASTESQQQSFLSWSILIH